LSALLATPAGSWTGVLHLWGLDAPSPAESPSALEPGARHGCEPVVHLVRALTKLRPAPRLWLLTRGAPAVAAETPPLSPAPSPLWGLGRVVMSEHPELRCVLLDLDPGQPADEDTAVVRDLCSPDGASQIAARGGVRYVARLGRPLTDADDAAVDECRLRVPEGQGFELGISRPGRLVNLTLVPSARRAVGPGLVEIEVAAAGLN